MRLPGRGSRGAAAIAGDPASSGAGSGARRAGSGAAAGAGAGAGLGGGGGGGAAAALGADFAFASASGFHSSSAAGRSSQSLTSWYAAPQASEQNETPCTSVMHMRQTGFSHALQEPTDGDSGWLTQTFSMAVDSLRPHPPVWGWIIVNRGRPEGKG